MKKTAFSGSWHPGAIFSKAPGFSRPLYFCVALEIYRWGLSMSVCVAAGGWRSSKETCEHMGAYDYFCMSTRKLTYFTIIIWSYRDMKPTRAHIFYNPFVLVSPLWISLLPLKESLAFNHYLKNGNLLCLKGTVYCNRQKTKNVNIYFSKIQ